MKDAIYSYIKLEAAVFSEMQGRVSDANISENISDKILDIIWIFNTFTFTLILTHHALKFSSYFLTVSECFAAHSEQLAARDQESQNEEGYQQAQNVIVERQRV